MGDLNLLLQALEMHRVTLPPPGTGWQDAAFSSTMPDLPLFHRLGEPLREAKAALETGRVTLELAGPKVGREELGTDRCVFASFGVAAYSSPPIVLAFGPVEDFRADRISVPWDSRGVGRFMGWITDVHRQKIEQYSLPASADEAYLARHLSTCFQTWETFLSGSRPVAPDPPDVRVLRKVMETPSDMDLLPLSTPEARFSLPQEVGQALMAVFVDADFPDTRPAYEGWLDTYLVLRRIVESRDRKGFRSVRRMKRGADLVQAASNFTRERLRASGERLK
jgi:hypothetical protein